MKREKQGCQQADAKASKSFEVMAEQSWLALGDSDGGGEQGQAVVTRAAGASTEKARSELLRPHHLADPLPPHLTKTHHPQVPCRRSLGLPAVITEQQYAHCLTSPALHAAGHVFYYSPSLFVRFCPTPIPQNSRSLLFLFSACLAIEQTTPLLASFISPLSTLPTAQT